MPVTSARRMNPEIAMATSTAAVPVASRDQEGAPQMAK